MSDLLSIGASALAAYRNALNTVGENVANSQTPGYARRKVVLEEATALANADIAYRDQIHFNGVNTVGIERAWNGFLATEARHAGSGAGRADIRQQWLTNVETALDDGPAGIGASITGFFTAAAGLAADPGDTLGRRSVLAALDNVASAFRRGADGLARISDGIGETARLEANALNDALTALADVNGAITAASQGGAARASLEDERDRLIDLIAGKIDISVTIAGDGRATIGAANDPGLTLLGPNGPGLVTVETALDGRLSFQLSAGGTRTVLPASSGAIAGLVDMASTVADRRAQLDELAVDFAAMVNDWSADGLDVDGNAGGDLVDAATGAAAMQTLVTDPDLVAAAGTDGTTNGNLLALDAIRTTNRIEERWTSLVSSNAQQLASARAEGAAASRWRDNAYAALDEVTGVDLDFEAAELLRYQQAYNAAARIIQVARESIQAIFDAM
jgi:flagellar hook-associated protein 1 FlgK